MRVAMPAPEGLLNSLTGHPTALDQTLGCMTGLFHVFEGHPAFMGRRYSSTRIGIHSGEAQLRTQPESQPHRHDSPNNLFSKVDDTHKKAVQSTKQHHRCHSDLAVNPSRTVPDFSTLKDGNGSGQVEPTSADSEGTVDALAFYENESLRAAALFAGDSRRRSDLDQRENSKRNEGLPKARLADNDVCSADIRDAILASFQRKIEHSKSTKANSEQSLTSSCNQGSLRTRRDGAVSRKSMDLPRSSSPYEPAEPVNWKDGLRSSTSPPRKLSHHNSPERRVEPKKDRGRSLSKDHYPFASLSPKRFPGTSQGPSPQDRRHGEILNQDSNFKESPGASDFRESLGPFLISAQERQNVPAQGTFASRSGVSSESNLVGVSHQRFNSEAESNQHPVVPNVIARLMGLEEIPASNQQGIPSSRVPDAKPRGDKFFRGLVQFDPQIMRPTSPSPPPPCHSKKYVVHHLEQPSAYFKNEYRMGAYEDHYPAQYRLEQELCSSEEDRDYEYLNSVSFLPFEDEHQEGAHPMSRQLAESGKLADPTTQAEDINIVAPEKKKKMIRKILEAMRPKVFSRRKQTEQEKSPVIKLITNDVQPVLQELDLETQQQTTLVKVVTGLRLPSETEYEEPSRYTTSDTSSVKQVQEGQTDSSCESSVVKTFILQPDEEKIVVMKPNTRSEDSQAGLSQVRHVEAASSTSTDKEVVPTRRTSPTNNEDWNLNAKDQRLAMKPVKPRVPADNPPRSARAKSSLESDYESDPSSTTQNDKSNGVPESRKIRTTARQRNPSSKSPSPQIQRQNGRCSSPEARPPTRSFPSKDHYKTGEVGRRSVAAKAKNDSRVTPANPKAQLAKEETLKKRVTENPDDSRLRKSSLKSKPTLSNIEKPAAKEKISVRSTGAKARSPAAPRKVHISRSSTTDAVTRDKSDGSNSALLQPAAPALPQTSGSEPVLVTVQPEPGRSKNPHIHTRHTPTEVQKTPEDSVGDHCEISSEPEKLEADSLTPFEAQPLLQMPLLLQAQEATLEVSEELTTPRGIPSVHCEILDSKLDEGLDRPSPISVLDANAFDEELSPSPSSPRHSFPVLQDSETTYNDEGYESCDKDLEAYNETPSALKEGDPDLDVLFSKGAEGQRAQVESTSDTKNSLNKSQSFFKDAGIDGERALEKSFLLAPKVATSCRFHDSNETSSCVCDKFKTKPSGGELTDTENIINENLLESLQSNGILQENNHMLLLDCLEEIMERILDSQSDLMLWSGLPPATLCERSKGKQLEQELWIELRDIQRTASSEDICETVHRLLQRDLIRCQGRQWPTFTKDREQIGIDMETMIVEDLIEEAVQDLCALQWYKRSPPGDSSLQTNS